MTKQTKTAQMGKLKAGFCPNVSGNCGSSMSGRPEKRKSQKRDINVYARLAHLTKQRYVFFLGAELCNAKREDLFKTVYLINVPDGSRVRDVQAKLSALLEEDHPEIPGDCAIRMCVSSTLRAFLLRDDTRCNSCAHVRLAYDSIVHDEDELLFVDSNEDCPTQTLAILPGA